MVIDPEKVAGVIREAAELDVLPRFRKLAESEIMEKAPGDLVTVADIDAELRIGRALEGLTPGAHVLGEEMASRKRLDLDEYHTEEATWLIDPVDGTRNFARGEAPFAIVVAYVAGGETRAAWIYLPVEDRMIVAERGAGAWTTGGGRLVVSDEARLAAMSGMINFRTYEDVAPEKVKAKAAIFAELRNFRCAAYDFVQLASGAKHFSLYRRLWPWDHAAGALIFAESGGYFARVDGLAYRPLQRIRGLLCAPTPVIWQDIHALLSAPA